MERTSNPQVCLFAKAPVPGAVKTRMQPELGAHACAALASTMLRQLAAMLSQHWPGPRAILAAPDLSHPVFGDLAVEFGFSLSEQLGADLGQRMGNALEQGIRQHGAAMVIGADVPHLPVHVLQAAMTRLRQGEEVVGPSSDGGFYLLGLQCWDEKLFSGIRWGTGQVLGTLLENGESCGRDFSMLEEIRDIDHYRDLLWLAQRDERYRSFGEHTDEHSAVEVGLGR